MRVPDCAGAGGPCHDPSGISGEAKGLKYISKKQRLLLILLALAMCLLTACGKDADPDELPPEEELALVPNAYFIGSQSLTAVEAERGVTLQDIYATESGAFVYTYVGFEVVNESVQNYVTRLIDAENGFKIVNGETFRSASAPDFTQPEGTVSLSKPADNDKITVIRLDWSADQCVASISIEDAPIEEPKKTPTNKNNIGLTHTGASDYLKELSPSVLGLEGDSMEDYNIYIMTGFTYVDGEACLRIHIYANDASTGTNVHVGTYFMSGNAEHIYRLSEDGLAIEMDQN